MNCAEVDYLTSSNFLDMLDTGILVCHLVRIIQDRARAILIQHMHTNGGGDVVDIASVESTPRRSPTRVIINEDAQSPENGTQSPVIVNEIKQAQQYLHALLRGANNNSTLLAAAKVCHYILFT